VLNNYLGGFRPGELTILSGPPGSGKTTLLCGLCVDLLEQDIPTLFCSLEVDNLTLMQWMMQQHAGFVLFSKLMFCKSPQISTLINYSLTETQVQDTSHLTPAAAEFCRLPLHLLHNYSEWLNTMTPTEMGRFLRAVVQAHNIRHVVVDNTQYLVSNTMNVVGADKYR
jgi:twinkle protein